MKRIALALSSLLVITLVQVANASENIKHYHFQVTKGKGLSVCDAYLKRLNSADYSATPPYCNIPEETQVPGFTPLHRVPLTAEEIVVIGPRISMFDMTGKQGSKEQDAAGRVWQIQHGVTPVDPLRGAEQLLKSGWSAWRFDPPLHIDNEVVPDNVLVWPELGCGHAEQNINYETDGRKPIKAYILAAGNERLNIPKTKAIFGHPSGGYPIRLYNGSPDPEFRPIGATIGFFKYENLYYIDTYLYNYPLNTWGFLTGGSPYKPNRAATLAVFLRQHGKTRRVCTYHMTETD